MKIDITLLPSNDMRRDAELIQMAEQSGFDAAWIAEVGRNPVLPLTIATKMTQKIQLGTQAASAFPRSPMVTAQIAWDLARQSGGRFTLGLGGQGERETVGDSDQEPNDVVGRMREYIESIRAIWNTFQTGARLRYRGEHYQFRLMAPFFNPGPIEQPEVPIYLAGADRRICQLAGEVAQGLQAPAFHTLDYLRDVILPAVDEGLASRDRSRSNFAITVPVLVVSGRNAVDIDRAAEAARQQLTRYTSAAANRSVIDYHGWDVKAGELISDEMLSELAIIAKPEDILTKLEERYRGLADRVCLQWEPGNSWLLEAIASNRNR